MSTAAAPPDTTQPDDSTALGGDPGGSPVVEAGEWRRLRACVERWPECEDSGYDPRCCRFPKSCSCMVYDEGAMNDMGNSDGVNEAFLEPIRAADEVHLEPMTTSAASNAVAADSQEGFSGGVRLSADAVVKSGERIREALLRLNTVGGIGVWKLDTEDTALALESLAELDALIARCVSLQQERDDERAEATMLAGSTGRLYRRAIAAEAVLGQAQEAIDGLLNAISEWFAGDVPPQLRSDHRVQVAALAVVPAEGTEA